MGATRGAGTAYPSGAHEFTPGFKWGSCYSIFSYMCMFCRSLFVLLYFFFWPLCCLSYDIQILIAPLVSSNSSYTGQGCDFKSACRNMAKLWLTGLVETQFLVAFFVCGLGGGRFRVRARVFITTFNNISVKSWSLVLLVEKIEVPIEKWW